MQYLVGEAPRLFNPHTTILAASLDNVRELLRARSRGSRTHARPSARQPLVARSDTARDFVWYIRNLPWASDVYSVSVEPEAREVVVRTSNKKFFKKLRLPELDAAQLPLSASELSWKYTSGTLTIAYRKPPEVLAAEQQEQVWRLS